MTSSCSSRWSTSTSRTRGSIRWRSTRRSSSLQSYVDDPNTDPDLAEYIAYSQARWGTETRYEAIPTAAQLAGLDLPTIERVWRDRFTNASDWVFAVSGDFQLDDARDLARRYIGTLAGGEPTENYKDFQIDPPSTVVTKEVHAGTGDKGSLTFDWNTADSRSRCRFRLRRRAVERVERSPDGPHPRGVGRLVLAISLRGHQHRARRDRGDLPQHHR